MMDLTKGFTIRSPALFIPWEATDADLTAIFKKYPLKHVTRGYFTIECEPFAGLYCALGFHLHEFKVLTELEFFRESYPDQKKSYDEFQSHLETAFGPPTHTEQGSEGFSTHVWTVPGARIVHRIFDRFGPEEHVRIVQA